MTTIDDTRSLHDHLLTFIKKRIAAPATYPGDVRTGFLAGLGPNGHTITPQMQAQLNGYNWVTTGNVGQDFWNFAMTNLPGDGETVAAYVLRYQFDRLGKGALVDDDARAAVLNHLVLLSDPKALTIAWNDWLPTDPANGGRTFPQQLNAFKTALLRLCHMPTSNAVNTLAQAQGFDVQGWANQQLAAIAAGAGGSDRWLPKLEEGLACWNWALTGYTPILVTPDDIFTWLHMPLRDSTMPAPLAAVTDPVHVAARDVLVDVKRTMHANNLGRFQETYTPRWSENPNLVTLVWQLNQRVYPAVVALYGMAVVPNSSVAIGVECVPTEGVSWEHWWVEIDTASGTTVVETFPTQKFSMNATALRQVQRMNGPQAARYRVMRIPVQNLLQAHSDHIGLGLVQYL